MRKIQLLPPGATGDASLPLETRALRALGDGTISVILAAYLTAVGLDDLRIGVVVTLTLLGSAALKSDRRVATRPTFSAFGRPNAARIDELSHIRTRPWPA